MSGFFNRPDPQQAVPRDLQGLRGQGIEGSQNALQQLLGIINQQPGQDVLNPLRQVSDDRLKTNISKINSQGGRWSSANLYQQGGAVQQSQNDFNLLASQILERGQDRRMQGIMGLLGQTLGPTFGGPFTQGSSGFENALGLLSILFPGGGGGQSAPQNGGGGGGGGYDLSQILSGFGGGG